VGVMGPLKAKIRSMWLADTTESNNAIELTIARSVLEEIKNNYKKVQRKYRKYS
jgi:predicted transcriptional regulator